MKIPTLSYTVEPIDKTSLEQVHRHKDSSDSHVHSRGNLHPLGTSNRRAGRSSGLLRRIGQGHSGTVDQSRGGRRRGGSGSGDGGELVRGSLLASGRAVVGASRRGVLRHLALRLLGRTGGASVGGALRALLRRADGETSSDGGLSLGGAALRRTDSDGGRVLVTVVRAFGDGHHSGGQHGRTDLDGEVGGLGEGNGRGDRLVLAVGVDDGDRVFLLTGEDGAEDAIGTVSEAGAGRRRVGGNGAELSDARRGSEEEGDEELDAEAGHLEVGEGRCGPR